MMAQPRRRSFRDLPPRFIAALLVAAAYVVFLTVDQVHWWRLKPDYAFGWLVPIFVVYIVMERWGRLREALAATAPSPLRGWLRQAVRVAATALLAGGLLFFLLGAVYRAGAGSTQPGSLALAVGFTGILLGLVYFNVPEGAVSGNAPGSRRDSRLQAVTLFLFPALVWILSAPLVTAVENAVSLFLLRRVVTVVFTLFSLLGFPLVQEGNVLVLPHGRVGVAEACSGIRSLTACLFAGSFLAAVFLDKFWKKVVLVASALVLAFFTNLLRSLFLTAWAYAYGSDAIEGTLHDATGFAVLGLTSLSLFCLLPLFRGGTWRRWAGMDSVSPA
jgi:exosortase/archaeosortase family protein